MNKPFTTEIIEKMAAHSDLSAAYASAMKWDWLRRQKVGDIERKVIVSDCAFCRRWPEECGDVCILAQGLGKKCTDNGTFYVRALDAFEAKDQQAYTTAANDLYYLIMGIIDDLYKPEPKKEVFYHIGQKFAYAGSEYMLSEISMAEVMMVNVFGSSIHNTKITVRDREKITEAEFAEICKGRGFTLIEDKK